MTGPFNFLNKVARTSSRHSVSSPGAITASGEANKAGKYRHKVLSAWALAFPEVPCPGSDPDSHFSPGGLDEVTDFYFRSAFFGAFGGCSESTT